MLFSFLLFFAPATEVPHTHAQPHSLAAKLLLDGKAQEQHKTLVIPKTLQPVWGCQLLFDFRKYAHAAAHELEVTVWDKDLLGKDALGSCRLPAALLVCTGRDKGWEGWMPLR